MFFWGARFFRAGIRRAFDPRSRARQSVARLPTPTCPPRRRLRPPSAIPAHSPRVAALARAWPISPRPPAHQGGDPATIRDPRAFDPCSRARQSVARLPTPICSPRRRLCPPSAIPAHSTRVAALARAWPISPRPPAHQGGDPATIRDPRAFDPRSRARQSVAHLPTPTCSRRRRPGRGRSHSDSCGTTSASGRRDFSATTTR